MTWRISVDRLSAKAYKVFRGMDMFVAAPVPEPIVMLMSEGASDDNDSRENTFREVFMKELIFSLSLMYREKTASFTAMESTGWCVVLF